MIYNAIIMCKEMHKGQKRKYSNRDYNTHPAKVAMRASLIEDITCEEICACWLQDRKSVV